MMVTRDILMNFNVELKKSYAKNTCDRIPSIGISETGKTNPW